MDLNEYVKFDDSNVVWMEDTTNYNLVIDPETWIFDKHLSDKIDAKLEEHKGNTL